jgi:hypothetical protein
LINNGPPLDLAVDCEALSHVDSTLPENLEVVGLRPTAGKARPSASCGTQP